MFESGEGASKDCDAHHEIYAANTHGKGAVALCRSAFSVVRKKELTALT